MSFIDISNIPDPDDLDEKTSGDACLHCGTALPGIGYMQCCSKECSEAVGTYIGPSNRDTYHPVAAKIYGENYEEIDNPAYIDMNIEDGW